VEDTKGRVKLSAGTRYRAQKQPGFPLLNSSASWQKILIDLPFTPSVKCRN